MSATSFWSSLSKLISKVLSIIYFLLSTIRSAKMEMQNLREDLNMQYIYNLIMGASYV